MHSIYRHTSFIKGVPRVGLAPDDSGYEIAFAGRSNAGKSTAINAITSQKGLARTSKTPGRTQQLMFFRVDDQRRFVDLPGYGYAKVPAAVQKQWQSAMENYFRNRQSLCGVFLVMDVRHPLTEYDRRMMDWCDFCNVPLHIALTKADKLKYGAASSTLRQVTQTVTAAMPDAGVQLFSGLRKTGLDEAQRVLDRWFEIETGT